MAPQGVPVGCKQITVPPDPPKKSTKFAMNVFRSTVYTVQHSKYMRKRLGDIGLRLRPRKFHVNRMKSGVVPWQSVRKKKKEKKNSKFSTLWYGDH